MIHVCNCCGKHSDEPHGCDCGGDNIPSDPLPDSLDLSVGIEFGIFGPGDTGNDESPPDDGYPSPAAFRPFSAFFQYYDSGKS